MSKPLIVFFISTAVLIFGLVLIKPSDPSESVIGVKHESQGEEHIQQGEQFEAYNSKPASSGPHYSDATAPTAWGIYSYEIQAEVYLHNLEHGGVLIAYNPEKLSGDDLGELKEFLIPSDEKETFKPARFILMPSTSINQALGLAAWGYTLDLSEFDKESIRLFYEQHANNTPESGAPPTNKPVDQG